MYPKYSCRWAFGTVVQAIDRPVFFCAFNDVSIMWHELGEISNDSSKMGLKQFNLHCPRPVDGSILFSDKNYTLRVQEKKASGSGCSTARGGDEQKLLHLGGLSMQTLPFRDLAILILAGTT